MTGDAVEPVESVESEEPTDTSIEITVIDDDALTTWLENEGLVVLPETFFSELMTLMEAHVMAVVGIDHDRLNELTTMLEMTIGEEGMIEISLEEFITWLRVLNDM